MNQLAIFVAILVTCVPSVALCCGSMGLNNPHNVARLAEAVFLPMLALVPIELGFLKWLGGLHGRVIKAYLLCLPGKALGITAVSFAVKAALINDQLFPMQRVVAAELVYSAAHLIFSCLILRPVFEVKGKALLLSSTSISTVVPWLYSFALWQIFHSWQVIR